MSWFSELTNKAEALLVRLDQDAAQVLQNSDNILNGTGVLDQVGNVNHIVPRDVERPPVETQSDNDTVNYRGGDIEQLHLDTLSPISTENISDSHQEQPDHQYTTTKLTPNGKIDEVKSHLIQKPFEHTPVDSSESPAIESSNLIDQDTYLDGSERPEFSHSSYQTKKFKFQTGKLKRVGPHLSTARYSSRPPRQDLYRDEAAASISIASTPKVDDIRASINQSLRDYSLGVIPSSNQQLGHYTPSSLNQTTYSSYYDDQPNLIPRTDDLDIKQRNGAVTCDLTSKRNSSSESFKVDVPDRSASTSSGDIASQILRQSAFKRKSTFNLHQVINRLANQNGQPYTLFDDRTIVRMRRARMRAASYMRRLNYYFRIYPKLKNWMIGYLIVLQLLVVYVLFFYQSTSSSTYLSSQVKEQQESLFEPTGASASGQSHMNRQAIK